jgi:hypothetical protein
MVPAFSWKEAQRRPGLPASERIASEGDNQNGRIVVKLVAIGQTNAMARNSISVESSVAWMKGAGLLSVDAGLFAGLGRG